MSDYIFSRLITRIAKKMWNDLPNDAKKQLNDGGMTKEDFIYGYTQKGLEFFRENNPFNEKEMKEFSEMSDEQLDTEIIENLGNIFGSMTVKNTKTNEEKTYPMKPAKWTYPKSKAISTTTAN